IGTLWGGAIGAALIVQLHDYLATAGFEETGIITGTIFILVVLLFRRGIWGTARDLIAARRARSSPAPETDRPTVEATVCKRAGCETGPDVSGADALWASAPRRFSERVSERGAEGGGRAGSPARVPGCASPRPAGGRCAPGAG